MWAVFYRLCPGSADRLALESEPRKGGSSMAIRTSHPYGANQRISGGSTLGIGVEARRAGARTGRTDPGVSAQWNTGPHTTGPMFPRAGPRLSRVFLLRRMWLVPELVFGRADGGITLVAPQTQTPHLPASPVPPTVRDREETEQAIVGKVVELLSARPHDRFLAGPKKWPGWPGPAGRRR